MSHEFRVMKTTPQDVTGMLARRRGDNKEDVAAELVSLLYDELHRLASYYFRRERTKHTLQPTALVHEAYLRLVAQQHVVWKNRSHFLGVAAQLMRRILVDHARGREAAKRGGRVREVTWERALAVSPERAPELLALDEALSRLASIDPQQARVVELRFFGGLTVEETAQALSISPATVKREWSMAKAWLSREIREGTGAKPDLNGSPNPKRRKTPSAKR